MTRAINGGARYRKRNAQVMPKVTPTQTISARCANGIKFSASSRIRPGQANSVVTGASFAWIGGLFDDSASMAIGNSMGGQSRSAPHPKVSLPEGQGHSIFRSEAREINPGDRW